MPWGRKRIEGTPEGCREVTREGLTEKEKIWSREMALGRSQEPVTTPGFTLADLPPVAR